jgi:hypothetical protein
MMTGISLPGAMLNRERDPIIGLNTRNRLPRSSIKTNEYLPHIVRNRFGCSLNQYFILPQGIKKIIYLQDIYYPKM